jgi:hypothetical protein
VRVLDEPPHQVTFPERLDKFLEKYPPVTEAPGEAKPLYIVATSGGGIRAAFWTACVLSRIQDEDPQFAEHLFAISSVSGGSLGGAVFTALVKEKQEGRSESLFEDAQNVLKGDFLSPTIAMMLTGDLLQDFIPIPFEYLSRARALEQSWEIAWHKAIKNNRFAQPMTSLWEGDADCNIPSLFLNGTMVEDGRRMIASNIKFNIKKDPSVGVCDFSKYAANIKKNLLVDAYDVYDFTGNKDMRLSTAVDNSARFTYVSPAGTLVCGWHIVDGGYFDNSGTVTGIDLFYAIMRKLEKEPKNVKLVGIMITNDPNEPRIKPLRFLAGFLAPLDTMLQVREAHSDYSLEALAEFVKLNGGTFVHFKPCKDKVKFPLGWSLSEVVREKLAEQAEQAVYCQWPPDNNKDCDPCAPKNKLAINN